MAKLLQHANRDSNLELLRIVAMAFIVLNHMIVHGLQLISFEKNEPSVFANLNIPQSYLLLVASSFFTIGVNVFVLISGYYGIKLKWKSLLNLAAICYFYTLVNSVITTPDFLHLGKALSGANLFMNSWFIPCYVTLILLSPLVNKGIENLSNRNFFYVLLGFIFVVFWFGFAKHAEYISPTKGVVQMLLIYLIGRGLNKLKNIYKMKDGKQYHYLIIYILVSLLLGVICILLYKYGHLHQMYMMYSYINPLVVLSSVFLFLVFTKISIKSKWINWAATSVLAILLLQDASIGNKYIYPFIANICKEYGLFSWTTFGLYALIFVLTMIVPILIDQLRILLLTPVVDWLVPKCQRIQSFVDRKLQKLDIF